MVDRVHRLLPEQILVIQHAGMFQSQERKRTASVVTSSSAQAGFLPLRGPGAARR